MTRAKRYANHAGGRKYSKDTGEELAKSSNHKDAEEKLAASEVFREMWHQCRNHEGYAKLKEEFIREQRDWDSEQMKPTNK